MPMAFASWVHAFVRHDGTLFHYSRTAFKRFTINRRCESIQRRSFVERVEMVPKLPRKYKNLNPKLSQTRVFLIHRRPLLRPTSIPLNA